MPRKRFYQITKDDREIILEGICQGLSAQAIASQLGKDATSISRELKRHRSAEAATVRRRKNLCLHYKSCDRHNLCQAACAASFPCARCDRHNCRNYCTDYRKEVCVRIRRFPYVCNGCLPEVRRACCLEKYSYHPSVAHAVSDKCRAESRSGSTFSLSELAALDRDISPLLRESKQSVESALAALGDTYHISSSTIRRYIDNGGLEALRIHLLKACGRKRPRKKAQRKSSHTDDGRSYADFMALGAAVRESCWEADSVIGAKSDRQRFFTFISRQSSLLGIKVMPDGSAGSIVAALDEIELALDAGGLCFSNIFSVLLVDNGAEFSDPDGMERSALDTQIKRCRVFYCDPYSSWQKGKIEGIHTFIRRVLPKGVSFARLDQVDACLLASHINSYLRADASCPYLKACQYYTSALLDCLGIEHIPAKEVRLRTDLL